MYFTKQLKEHLVPLSKKLIAWLILHSVPYNTLFYVLCCRFWKGGLIRMNIERYCMEPTLGVNSICLNFWSRIRLQMWVTVQLHYTCSFFRNIHVTTCLYDLYSFQYIYSLRSRRRRWSLTVVSLRKKSDSRKPVACLYIWFLITISG